ncbi:MAG: hypothetical protein U1F61_16615 [Opitutaceae bacterium]
MRSSTLRTGALIGAMAVGALLPGAHVAAGAIRWLIITLLFLVFLQTPLRLNIVHRSHGWLLLANVAMGGAGWLAGWLMGGRDVALALFFAGITPTATAAPVIVGFLKGRVDYVVAAFLITNFSIAIALPVLLPVVIGRIEPALFLQVFSSVAQVVFAPLIAAWVVRRIHPPAKAWPERLQGFSFTLWLISLFLITANTSHFVRTPPVAPVALLFKIGTLTALLCAANFWLGRRIGGVHFGREASQSLGQKNTTFTLYLALTYASPLVALGPTFYILWHNLWNSWQLHRGTPRS